MSNIEIAGLVVSVLGIGSFAALFTILYSTFSNATINEYKTGKKDIELIDDFPSKFLVDVTRQSRWARGDTQIIGWLFPKVKNKNNKTVKNPINLLGKYKIFDNIVRMFLNPMLLITLKNNFDVF